MLVHLLGSEWEAVAALVWVLRKKAVTALALVHPSPTVLALLLLVLQLGMVAACRQWLPGHSR